MMRSRRASDESGVALALAIMIVVVAGVMGAGLLVFVRGDIQSAAQANQGQRAFYIADAGVQAAARHLLSDALPENYDEDGTSSACNDPADGSVPVSSVWSAEKGGKTQSISDGKFVVSIRYVGAECNDPGTGVEAGLVYFEVISEGTFGDAKRRIEAVYSASEVGAPLTVFAAGDVVLGSTSVISGGSVFSGGNVTVNTGAKVSGEDKVYGNWKKAGYNETSRNTTAAGIGAAGTVSGATTILRYDSSTTPKFVSGDPATGELTYPFSPNYWSDTSRRVFMREEAASQGNLLTTATSFDWPEDSTRNTVVYVDLTGSPGDVDITSTDCGGPKGCRGTLIVEGGGVNVGSGSVFRGNVITFGDSGSDLPVNIEDGARLEGTVSSGDDLSVGGEISSPGRSSYLSPGMHGVELESWRELYE